VWNVTRSRTFFSGALPKALAATKALVRAPWLMVMFTIALAGCGAGGSPTSPSNPFTGTWSGTFGAGIPMSLTLAQDGSTVAGLATITLSSGTSSQSVSGTASGNTATVSFTSGGNTLVSNATLTLSGSTLSMGWPGSNGTPITGTLTATTSAPVPAPASGTFDGTYDFSFMHTNAGAPDSTVVLNRFFIVTNGRISASDGTLSGSATPIGSGSFSGTATFVGPCPINNGLADYSGTINAGGGLKTGLGSYTCRIGGISRSWRAYNGS